MQKPIEELLASVRRGDQQSLAQWNEAVYEELRRLARAINVNGSSERDSTLNTTALVHEAWVRLSGAEGLSQVEQRREFLAYAAAVMRNVLVDYARARKAEKRGGALAALPLDDVLCVASERSAVDVLALDEALQALQAIDPRSARLVELRFFGGLSEAEAAATLEISLPTAARDWSYARAWLRRRLRSGDTPP